MATSNTVVGLINLAAMLLSVPVVAVGVWLSTLPDEACVGLLQWPVIALGVLILAGALAGFVGALWRVPWLLLLHMAAMLALILLLMGLVVFVYVVTSGGSGHLAPDRVFLEYRLDDYSGWLRRRVQGSRRWERVQSCLSSTSTCSELNQKYRVAEDFFKAAISPYQSGCCKPPTECGLTFVNPTYWVGPGDQTAAAEEDCALWSNDQARLCYACSSCKAGLLENLKREWRRADLVLLLALVVLVGVYLMDCYALRNTLADELFRRRKQGTAVLRSSRSGRSDERGGR